MTEHRKPCYPPTWDDNRANGNCKWCDEPLPRNKDDSISKVRRWHAECKKIASLLLVGGLYWARFWLEHRDGKICRSCKKSDCGPLELDHVRPLWSVDRDAPDAWKFWTLENLQLLGTPCHKIKTAREAKVRAKGKRIRKKLNGETRPRAKIPSRDFDKPPDGYKHFPESRPLRGRGA